MLILSRLVPNGPGGGEGAMAAHSGGSCQASMSFDNGGTWKVLHTYQGGCPRGVAPNSNIAGPDQKFAFDVPAETQSGNAIFAWYDTSSPPLSPLLSTNPSAKGLGQQ